MLMCASVWYVWWPTSSSSYTLMYWVSAYFTLLVLFLWMFFRQWLQIQKLRRKVKKNVDTKASKGRKIRWAADSVLSSPIINGCVVDCGHMVLFVVAT